MSSGSHVVKDLRSKNALNLEELSILRRVTASSEKSRKKLVDEVHRLSTSLNSPYISLLVENAGLSSEEQASLEAPSVQESSLP
nr:hypothetical protein [Tanacetum cinerariifolium]